MPVSLFRGFLFLVAVILAGLLGACDNGGAPSNPADGPVFSFSPSADSLTLDSSAYLDFQVSSSPSVTFNVAWTLDDQPYGVGRNLRFFPPDLGPMTLAARASYEDKSALRTWALDVRNSHVLDFAFIPAASQLHLVQGQALIFAVTHQWPFACNYQWRYRGAEVGVDSLFHFVAVDLGSDSLQVSVLAGEDVIDRTWQWTITENIPQAVAQVLTENGQQAGSVEVIWSGVEQLVDPILGYDIAISLTGPITADSWHLARDLGRFAHQGPGVWHRHLFTKQDDGMIPGSEAWFAVRSVDTREVRSDVVTNAHRILSDEWWVQGTVRDEQGHPLEGITVADEDLSYQASSAADGSFRLGPYADFLEVNVRTTSRNEDLPGQPGTSWHDCRWVGLTLDGADDLDLRLITRWGSDPECAVYQESFLEYFTYITRTSIPTPLRPNQKLWKWASYPLRVHIPAFVANGVDFQAACLSTLEMWNTTMGEVYFVAEADPQQAEVVFLFGDTGSEANGQTSLLLPDDAAYQLGDIIPEKMQVYIHDTLAEQQRVQETALHELGHVLGLNRHVYCSQAGYLMYVTAVGALDDGPENAIHIDEQRAVRTIRSLPQGYDMGHY